MLFGHGGDVYSLAKELGVAPYEILDFSSNCSPLPYPKELEEYLCRNIHQMHLLPEVDSLDIRSLLAKRYGLSEKNFLIGNGTTQWIFALPRLLKAQNAFVCLPTYADYKDASKTSGLQIQKLGPFRDGKNETTSKLLQALNEIKEKESSSSIIFLCNPNNPTGLFINPDDLLEVILKKTKNLTWIIDEAYAPFVAEDKKSSLLTRDFPENVIILRSFSKIYGIPGLRVGCLVAKGAIMEKLWQQLRPWSVNRMAQLAVEYFLKERSFEEKVRIYCQDQKRNIVAGLTEIKALTYIEGKCHYCLFKLDKTKDASALCKELAKKGLLIRDCSNFEGLEENHIRISPRLEKDNEKLIKALKRLLS